MLEVLDQKGDGFCKHDLSLVDQTSAGDFLSVEYDLALHNSGSNLFNSEMWYEKKKMKISTHLFCKITFQQNLSFACYKFDDHWQLNNTNIEVT